MNKSAVALASRSRSRLQLSSAFLVIVLSASVAACGGSDDTTVTAAPPAVAASAPTTRNSTVPPNANTSNPAAAFYVDVTGLNLATLPPTRDPKSSNFPAATELPDGQLPPKGAVGNFILGPTHAAAPETLVQAGVPQGTIYTFTMVSANSVIYNPGIVRDEPTQNAAVYGAQTVAGDPSNLIITTSHPGTWTRKVSIYVPQQLVAGPRAPFIIAGDGGSLDTYLVNSLNNLIAQGRVPPMVAISVGNMGMGNIGPAVARRASAFGMHIAYFDPYPKAGLDYTHYAEPRALALASDFLVLTLPGGPQTFHIVDAPLLSALGPNGFLINIARGSVVDADALIAALKSGAIAGAALDVFEDEPRVPEGLMTLDNVILTPHIASATNETRNAMSELAFGNLHAHFSGKPVLTRVV